MSDPADKNETMPEPWEAVHKLAQDLHGALKVMFEAVSTLTSASSQMQTATESPLKSGNRQDLKLFEMDENRASLSSVPNVVSNFTSSKRKRSQDSTEKWREGTLVIHFTTYGTAAQKRKTAETMLHNLEVKGYDFTQVMLDEEEIPLAE